MAKSVGKVSQIIGPVVDVEFSGENSLLPKIYDALEIKKIDGTKLILEVQSHIGEETVRTISMDSTDGLSRGTEVISLENPIQMPIGDDVYGRLLNVIGDPIDGLQYLPKEGKNGLIWVLMMLIRPLTTVNRPKIPHNFHSRLKAEPYPPISSPGSVNIQKHVGVGQAVNLNTFVC